MNIETQANLGDRVFYIRKRSRGACPVCGGAGLVTLTDKDYVCPECKGKKTVRLKEPLYEVIPCTIGGIAAFEGMNNATNTYYTLFEENSNGHYTVLDTELLTDQTEAERKCRILNLKRTTVPLSSIQVPYAFLQTLPCNEKLCKRLDEFRATGTMTAEICLSEKGVLFDGYTAFLIYRLLGRSEVPVVYWPDDLMDRKAHNIVKNCKGLTLPNNI